jgi:Ca-activated chloride channel family protein
VANAIEAARARDIPLYVVGIGTTVGGMIPEPMRADGTRPPPVVHSALDRASLVQLAVAGGGEYFEVGDDSDRAVAFRIIQRLRQRSEAAEEVETVEELYWQFLMAAAVVLCLGTLLMKKRTELAWQATGALVVVLLLASVL